VFDRDCVLPRLKAGAYVRVAVADTGTGISAETLSRVAEPFFTTKPKGKGTGLGLSMAKGFAEQSGGAFAIASELGRGTTVTLWLPQADASVAPPPKDLSRGFAAAVGERRRVLLVDDDELVREVLMASLEDAGFLILEAEDATNALALLDAGAEVDALLTDFSMPGMDGLDLIREVHTRKPDLPAILLTGHVGEVTVQAVHRQRSDRFTLLQKPMKPAQIAERLAALIA
jgi:CheY-like chemotaxis protein